MSTYQALADANQRAAAIIQTAVDAVEASTPSLAQRRVAFAICAGLGSVKDRAEKLGMSVKQIDGCRYVTMKKLGLHSDVQLLRYAVTKGYVTIDGVIDQSNIPR